MYAFGRNAEVEFRHEPTRAEVQCGSRDRRNGGNRRGAQCGHRRSRSVIGARRIDSLGSISQTLGEVAALPIDITAPAEQQIDKAEAWWLVNRTAAPDAIARELSAMIAILAQNPNIGRPATNVTRRKVRRVGLRRVGYEIYYRVTGSPPRLEVMASGTHVAELARRSRSSSRPLPGFSSPASPRGRRGYRSGASA